MVDVAVPTVPPLSNLRHIELVQTGDWVISSGRWKAARDDLVAAVAALHCPAVRRPIIKLGHSQGEQPLWQGNPTGAPAIGWIENLALTNQGHTLVADLVGMPGWLATPNDEGQTVIASAWPDRSVEGTYDFKCQLGHTHPFVVTAVALLGVTRPGVGTLKSLQDVGRLYGVQADAGTAVEARFDPTQPRDNDGRWTDTPGSGGTGDLDKLKLAGRIDLGPGERLVGSVAVEADDSAVTLAAVQSPDGPRLRVGTGIDSEETDRWRAGNRGHTANLNGARAAELAETLPEMVEVGQIGEARVKETKERLARLRGQERDLYRSQFPALTRTQGGELDRIDDRIQDLRADQAHLEESQAGRVGRLPAESQARLRQADLAGQQQLVTEGFRAGLTFEPPTHYTRDAQQLAKLRAELDTLQARQAELTRDRTPLSPGDAATLEGLAIQADQLDDDLFELVDSGVLAEGTIPGEWADLRYQVTMTETGPRYTLAVLPAGAPDRGETDSSLTPEQIQQLAGAIGTLLGEFREVPVAASTPPDAATRGWLDCGGEVQAHQSGRHNQETHGRRYGPDGNPIRRLVRGGKRRTVRVLGGLLRDLGDDEAANQPGMSGGPLTDLVRGIRDGVDGGQFTPDQALQLLSSLVFRPDVASNPRLSIALAEATGRLRGDDRRRDTPDVPRLETPTVPEPDRPPAPEVPAPPTPSAPSPAQSSSGVDLVPQLRSSSSSTEARQLLDGLTVAQLRAVADEVGAGYGSSTRKPDLLDSIVRRVVGFRERGESIMRGGGGPGTGLQAAAPLTQVAEAADVRTGAKVALLPSEKDARRLAVDGGEAAEQLHVTLLFLGEAAEYSPEARQAIVDEVRAVAEVIPPGEVDGMAISAFNPDKPDKDTAIVVELGGEGLEDVHGLVEQAVSDVAAESGLALPEQHTPWRPHTTLIYSDDLMNVPRLADRAGPVRLDRIRVAFGGENVDIPLSGEGSDLDVGGLTDDDMPVAASEVEAQESRRATRSDAALRRYWLVGPGSLKIRWNTPGDWTRCVRLLRRHVRDPKGLCSVYHRQRTGVYPGDRRNVGRRNASAPDEEAMTLPNPNPTIVHAAAQVSVDDVRTAYYRQAPTDRAWIREINQHPKLQLIVADGPEGTAEVDVDIDGDGGITFSEPVPVVVQYVRRDQVPQEVAASQFVYASAAESRPATYLDADDVEAHASHNQMTHGNRYGPDGKLIRRTAQRRPGSKADSADRAIRGAYDSLARGEGASIEAGELDGLLKALTGGGDEAKRANLAHLDVGGYGTLFATDKTDALDRSKMPQLGTNEQEMRPFLDLLRDRGVPVRIAEIDPTTLKPSQSEISGAKTGKLYGFMADDGWLPGGLLVTSGDGYVVDGHHRWSGAAAVRAAGVRPDMTVTGLIVDAPIDEVLQLAASVASFESLDFDREAAGRVAAAEVSNRPWSDLTEADYDPEQWRRACLLDRGPSMGDENMKQRYGLPVREPDGTLNRNAVHAAAGGHGIGAVKGIGDEMRRTVARKLLRLYAQIGDEPPDSLRELAGESMSASAHPHQTPAAEPGNPTTKEEEMPLSTEVLQRLGLADDAEADAVNAAVLALAERADTAPDPKEVAAAAAENDTLRSKVELLEEQVGSLSREVADRKAKESADVKASILDEAVDKGRIFPADKDKWAARYDKTPDAVADVLASIADYTAVPLDVQGSVGDPTGGDDAEYAEWDKLHSTPALAGR